ncbi:TrmH family RNA methyltransferase [Winogradskyella sp. A3E31]|uniref:TrmH family RNA methyltransferase n=1 Tax=Winogradskyella sp. A3E31 TaxID=3349637 RepID=UPI00398BA6DD
MQHTHYTSEFKPQQFPIVLVCDAISNAANVGSLFRVADAFGVEKLIFCGDNFNLGRRYKKTSRSTEKYVNYGIENNSLHVLEDLKKQGYMLIALEITESSQPISKLKITEQPVALVVGNEITGISNNVLEFVDDTFHINMYGHNSSMNVTQATSVALYELTKQMGNCK